MALFAGIFHAVGLAPSTRSATRLLSPRGLRRTTAVRMPEGPECTIHAERLSAACTGQSVYRAEIISGRYAGSGTTPGRGAAPEGWDLLQAALPASVCSVQSKGKFIFWNLESADGSPISLWSTLGMTAAWSPVPTQHARVGLELGAGDGQGGKWRLFFCDQRNFGTITVCTDAAKLEGKLASLGPSWLPPGSLGLEEFQAIARHQCRNKRGAAVPLAKFLMDQAKTSGIGNCKALSRAHALCEIYCGAVASHAHCAAVRISFLAADILSETLYLAQIWPFARCGDLQDDDWVQIHAAASDVIERVRAPAAFCYCARLVISLPASLLTLPAP
jgi:formamidopyrimidine-DNA glycosylase